MQNAPLSHTYGKAVRALILDQYGRSQHLPIRMGKYRVIVKSPFLGIPFTHTYGKPLRCECVTVVLCAVRMAEKTPLGVSIARLFG